MAKILQGINGPFTGKVGTVIGSSWRGIPYMKSAYKKRTMEPTDGERANRNKFAMAQSWLQPVVNYVRRGFKGYTQTVEGFMAAKSYLMRNAFEGAGSDLSINPALVKLSSGDLPLPGNIKVEKTNENQLIFTWDATIIEGTDKHDQAMLLAYNIDQKIISSTISGGFRTNGLDTLDLGRVEEGIYHVYIAFAAEDRSRQSESVYLGAVEVSD